MIALLMKVLEEIVYRTLQRVFSEQDQSRQTLLFYRTYPALRVGIQIGAPRWQGQAFYASCGQRLPELRAKLRVAIMQ